MAPEYIGGIYRSMRKLQNWKGLRSSWVSLGASWKGLRAGWEAPGGGRREKRKRKIAERSWYMVVPLVIVPYGAAAQKRIFISYLIIFIF